ncbi:MAG: hypothetical protein BWY42_00972 [Candidatus Omnitrophica bacterium ADurb.Bin277]|nr:MAG: hypothetical protein BWY42_00972 [Candidatus Omnitrophica bacterium ADurb.Bin277]
MKDVPFHRGIPAARLTRSVVAPGKFINRGKRTSGDHIVRHPAPGPSENIDRNIIFDESIVADNGRIFGKLNSKMRVPEKIHFDQRIRALPDKNAVIPVIHNAVLPDLHVVAFHADRARGSPRVGAASGNRQVFNPVIPKRPDHMRTRPKTAVKHRTLRGLSF